MHMALFGVRDGFFSAQVSESSPSRKGEGWIRTRVPRKPISHDEQCHMHFSRDCNLKQLRKLTWSARLFTNVNFYLFAVVKHGGAGRCGNCSVSLRHALICISDCRIYFHGPVILTLHTEVHFCPDTVFARL